MPSSFRLRSKEGFGFVRGLVKWVLLGAWVGNLSGGASALFLHALGAATAFRETHPYLLFGPPIAGLTLGSGFKGGEVAPLFCIGATLVAAFAHLTG